MTSAASQNAPYGRCYGCGRPVTTAVTRYPGWHDGCAADALPLEASGEVPQAQLRQVADRLRARRVDTTPRLHGKSIEDVGLPSTQGLPATPHEEQSARRLLRSVRLLLELGDTCYFCGGTLTALGATGITREHLTPTSRGGGHEAANVVAACWRCNTSKGDMTEEEFVDWVRRVAAHRGLT